MTVGKKLMVTFGAIMSLVMALCAFIYFSLEEIDSSQVNTFDEGISSNNLIHELRYSLSCQGLFMRSYLIDTSESSLDKLNECSDDLDKKIQELNSANLLSASALKELNDSNKSFDSHKVEFIDLVNSGKLDKAYSLMNEKLVQDSSLMESITTRLLEAQIDKIDSMRGDTHIIIIWTKVISGMVLLLILIVIIASLIITNKLIVKPLDVLKERAILIAQGNLTGKNLEVKGNDEISSLASNFNLMQKNIKSLITNINTNANKVSSSSIDISSYIAEIKVLAEVVDKSILETVDNVDHTKVTTKNSEIAMIETATGIQRIAESANDLNTTSGEADKLATEGTVIIDKAKDQMNSINTATSEVAVLVKKLENQTAEIAVISQSITAITEQTNLLALNASIEAARAGEHGKGFAVVADEVKKLAEESKRSAESINRLTIDIRKDTTEVLEAVVHAVDLSKFGIETIDDADDSFKEIQKSVRDMLEQITDISAVTEELAAGAQEVNASVTEISYGTGVVETKISEVSNSFTVQSNRVNDVYSSVVDLTRSSRNLKEELKLFNV